MKSLGDRMKQYEKQALFQALAPHTCPVLLRIDGKCFHTYTRGMEPFSKSIHNAMVEASLYLVEESGACHAYTQSDEASFVYFAKSYEEVIWFNGVSQKMASVGASVFTWAFNRAMQRQGIYASKPALFDARMFQVPSLAEGWNALLWREQDAIKNSVSMLAHKHFSNKSLHGVKTDARIAMLREVGSPWEDLPDHFQRGTHMKKDRVLFEPPLMRDIQNPSAWLYYGEAPLVATDSLCDQNSILNQSLVCSDV